MSNSLKTVLYALGLCIACSLLLTAASSGLKPAQQRNVLIDRHRNILVAAGLLNEARPARPAQIEALYAERIRPLWVDPAGRIVPETGPGGGPARLPIYLSVQGESVEGYIIPIDSRGLWGPIRGYIALARDGKTVAGFSVYQHAETPGLGGEIEKKWFRDNWVGKQIATQQGKFVSVGIAKGRVEETVPREEQPHHVDGISGATLTGKYLSAGIRDTLSRYEPVSIRFRQNQIRELGALAPGARP
jgi:Na+-transporting NADH:ubiquinone oxidoreductase subunit C